MRCDETIDVSDATTPTKSPFLSVCLPTYNRSHSLARAIRSESAIALHYWWGASVNTIAWWRRALGVARADPEGSRRLIQAASEAGADAVRGKPLPPAQIERRRQMAQALNLKQYLRPGYQGPCWSIADLQLLGTEPDEVIAARIGRTANAVRVMRTRRGIPSACDRRCRR